MLYSLRSRLIFSYVVIILLTLCIAGGGLLFLLADFQRGIVTQRLSDALGPAMVQARSSLRQGISPGAVAADIQDQVDPTWRVLLVNDQGSVIADSKNELNGVRIPQVFATQALTKFRFATGSQVVAGRNLLFAAAPIQPAGNPRTILLLATVIRPFVTGIEDLARPLLSAGAIALVVAILLALVLARSISKPLDHLTRATEAIARGHYDEPIPVQGEDEVGRLAASFRAMVSAVRRSQQTQKDFVANVSHELKTPLTSIQGFAQAIAEGATHDLSTAQAAAKLIYDESLRMARLVADLLTLARLDAGDVPLELRSLDLNAALPAWVERFQARAQRENVKLGLALDSPPPVVADAGRVEQVVANLIDNAIKYNRPGGSVTVSAARRVTPDSADQAVSRKSAPRQTWALIRIADTGHGIPARNLPHLFDRFYRADKARVAGGSGLGLSIVQEIVDAHGGRIEVASQEESGTTFSVWLPAKA